jgi:DNA-binding transcriptional LysR family regulator
MDSLGPLNAFVQAAEARSFTVAGRQLGVSSSAIGKAVARMEERLGVRLLHRSTRSVTLTAEGALFLVEPLICMAEQGLGIAYLPDFAIGRQLREGVLVTVLDDYTDRSGPLRVLWPSSRHLAPKLRVFVDFLAANLVPVVEGEAKRAGDSGISSYAFSQTELRKSGPCGAV